MAEDYIVATGGRRVQARGVRAREWSKAKRALFLDHLAATSNVCRSARAVGMTASGAHQLRRRDPVFAEAWGAALEVGYQHLEEKLLARALGQDGDADAVVPGCDPTAIAAGPFDPEAALRVLGQRNAAIAAGGRGRRSPPPFKVAPIEEVRAALMAKLDARARARAVKA